MAREYRISFVVEACALGAWHLRGECYLSVEGARAYAKTLPAGEVRIVERHEARYPGRDWIAYRVRHLAALR